MCMLRRTLVAVLLRAVALTCLLCAAGCSPKPSVLKWTEEVRLPDQRVVKLTREQHFDERDLVSNYSFEFKHPSTGETVRYENEREFTTVALYAHQGQLYLVVTPSFATHFDNAGCPNPRYFVFRYEDKEWLQIPLMQSPLKRVSENMTVDTKSVREEIKKRGFHVQADEVVPMNRGVGTAFDEYDLEKVKTQTFACPDRKRYQLN